MPYTSSNKYTFTSGTEKDNGTHTFSGTGFILKTASSTTITVTDGSKLATTSAITVNPAPATQLIVSSITSPITAGTAASVTVTAKDQYNNIAASYTGTVQFTSSDTGTNTVLPGDYAFLAGDHGAKNFSGGVTLTTAGAQSVTATDSVTASITGSVTGIVVNPGAAKKVEFTTQPGAAAPGLEFRTQPVVSVMDDYGNTVTGSSASITLAIGTNPSGGTLSGTKIIHASSGIATFDGLSINNAGTGYTITASSSGLTGTTSSSFNVALGPPVKLAFTAQPGGTNTAGAAFAIQPVIVIQDSNGNTVTDSSASVLLFITEGTGTVGATLSGVNNVSAVGGTATFHDLNIDKAGTGYTLTATSTGLNNATSNAFDITPGAPSKLAFYTQPSDTVTGAALATQPAVAIQDLNGNTVTDSSASITLDITTGTGTAGAALSGVNNVSAVGGIASFNGLSINLAGTGYTLNASAVGLELAVSNAFNITTPVIVSTGGGGGGGGGGSSGATLDELNRFMGEPGVFTKETSVRTFDSKAILSIAAGTKFNLPEDQTGSYITTKAVQTGAPPPPVDGSIIGIPYQFGPEGATFDPPLTLKMVYDLSGIPAGKNETDLKLGYWDGNKWQVLDSIVDPVNRTITAQVSHFSEYAVISVLPPPVFTLSSIKINTEQIDPGDTVTIETTVSNTGGSPGNYTLVLKVDGVQADSRAVNLDPGKSETVAFQLQKDDPGYYVVEINGETGSFKVTAPPPPPTTEPTPSVQPQATVDPAPTSTAETPVTTQAIPPAPPSTFPISWVILIVVVVAGVSIGLIVVRARGKNKKG